MSKGLWQLTVRGDFSSAHALRHYQGKCENMHGHNYAVEMSVEGETLTEDTELVVDFSVLKAMLRRQLTRLDHCDLNATPPFDRFNPSSENLARYLWQQLAPQIRGLSGSPIRLHSVTVSEKSTQSATYREVAD